MDIVRNENSLPKFSTANKHEFGLFDVDGEMVHFKPITDFG